MPEIEQITGIPEGTVKSHLFRARRLLKEAIEHEVRN
jgi:DNA-directed RNA polymerase specialized sigma24 family protein